MAIGQLYSTREGWTIMQLGEATPENYRRSSKMAKHLYASTSDKADRGLISGMISDCEYATEWLETGRRPGSRRGIERRAAYQRERPVDPIVMQAYVSGSSAGGAVQASSISDNDRQRIDGILQRLTERERECYQMVVGDGLPYSEAATLLGIEKGSVQWYVDNAKKKIQKLLFHGDLFDFKA